MVCLDARRAKNALDMKVVRCRNEPAPGYFHLDESAIEAEAIRRSAADIELLDRLLASIEARRDKALRQGLRGRNPAP